MRNDVQVLCTPASVYICAGSFLLQAVRHAPLVELSYDYCDREIPAYKGIVTGYFR
jgi:hypothetical protein